ncbi:MAG: peptide chain release factor 2 [Coriobacteriia bacterium]|nr:peptide chain release factor 2 [Coriobacteriia bacterium]
MLESKNAEINKLTSRADELVAQAGPVALRERLATLERRSAEPGFWDHVAEAKETSALMVQLRGELSEVNALAELATETATTHELALEADDEELYAEALELMKKLERALDEREVARWFDGQFDHSDVIVTITPGQGGLEAQDWTEMLFTMYLKFAEARGWRTDVHEAQAGESIGIDRAVFTLHGRNAYGMMRAEQGVHRLVRISPTDLKKRRQTTFAGVTVLPVLPDDVEVDIRDEDLRIDVYRSSGPGGQSVNTTDSAVRITHIPTGTVVTCQNEKSQHKNKDAALSILRARLFERAEEQRLAELQELRGPLADISWGSQIRSYVLYPYQMVKDLRTGFEKGNVEAVLAGDIEGFILAYHRWVAAGCPDSARIKE